MLRRLLCLCCAVLLGLAGCGGSETDYSEVTQKALENPDTSIKLLSHGSPLVRANSAVRLGEMGSKASAAIPELKKLEKDPDPQVRAAATQAISAIQAGGN